MLTVRSYGGSFDRFRVRLPPGAQLIDERAEDCERRGRRTIACWSMMSRKLLRAAKAATRKSSPSNLQRSSWGPSRFELSTEQPLGLTDGEPTVELAGFEVLGAVRQFGDVAIAVADDWQLRWENGPYVRQVERSRTCRSSLR